ncbi:MAG: TonB family protein [Alphaproteobacteria bacterium]|nr:TonB family protein [Alphaproteobacteria bacterium]
MTVALVRQEAGIPAQAAHGAEAVAARPPIAAPAQAAEEAVRPASAIDAAPVEAPAAVVVPVADPVTPRPKPVRVPVPAKPRPAAPVARPRPPSETAPTESAQQSAALAPSMQGDASHQERAPEAGRGEHARSGSDPHAAYVARVRAILQRRANDLGFADVQGAVDVSFTINAAGRIDEHQLLRSSGDYAVDRAIRAMLSSSVFPTPPVARFSGQVTIRIR